MALAQGGRRLAHVLWGDVRTATWSLARTSQLVTAPAQPASIVRYRGSLAAADPNVAPLVIGTPGWQRRGEGWGAWRTGVGAWADAPRDGQIRRAFAGSGSGDEDDTSAPPRKSGGHDEAAQDAGDEYVYDAPFWRPLKRVKILSVMSLAATTTSIPVMLALDGMDPALQTAASTGRIGIVATVGLFGLLTTSMLHLFSSPYVGRLRLAGDQIKVETCTLIGTTRHASFVLDDIGQDPPSSFHPLATFEAKGRTYYLDEKDTNLSDTILSRLPKDEHAQMAEDESQQNNNL